MNDAWIDNIVNCGEIFDSHWKTILARNGKPKELSMRFLPELDDKIWGLKKQKLVVVGGRPSNGKSVFLLQLADDLACQGKNIAFFSFEMSKEVCVERLIALKAGIDNWLLTTGKIALTARLPDVAKSIKEVKESLEENSLTLIDGIGRSLPDLNKILSFLPKDLDAVFIDYGNMVEVGGRSRKQGYDDYLKNFRALAIKNNFCAVLGTQINRNVQNKDGTMRRPTLADLKDTGELEQVADMVFILHRPWLYDVNEPKNKFLVDLAKNRDGRIGQVWCKLAAELYKIHGEDKDD